MSLIDGCVAAALDGTAARLTCALAGFVLRHGGPALDLARAGRWSLIALLGHPVLWRSGAENGGDELVRRLLTLRQQDILAHVGYPSSRSAVNSFTKLVPASCTSRSILLLVRCLETPQLEAVLAHLPRINWGVLALLQMHSWDRISPRLLSEVASSRADDRATQHSIIGRVADLRTELIRTGENPDRQYLAASSIIDRRLSAMRGRPTVTRKLEGLPAPIAGRVERLSTSDQFRREGIDMSSCVGIRWREGKLPGLAYFRVLPDATRGIERCTVSIFHDGALRVGDIRGVKNREVSATTRQFVLDWLTSKPASRRAGDFASRS